MWIQIIGPTGSGKNFVFDALKKDGFELLTFDVKSENPFERQVEYLMNRFRLHINASQVKDRKDVVTIRGFHDTHLIINQILTELTTLNDREYRILSMIYENMFGLYSPPPDVVVFMQTPKISALNRQKLNNIEVSEEFFNREVDLYSEFATRIGVPVIELDASQKADILLKNLDFGISSIKAANLGSQNIWKREFLR
jgi:deoxyadenosine/deoxycytidine kinase